MSIDPAFLGFIIANDEPLYDSLKQWLGWIIVMVIIVILWYIYIANDRHDGFADIRFESITSDVDHDDPSLDEFNPSRDYLGEMLSY